MSQTSTERLRDYLAQLPPQAQALLISDDNAPPEANVDPTELPDALQEAAEQHGVIYADSSDEFEKIHHAEDMFYNADGHLNGRGHELVADAAEAALIRAFGPRPLCHDSDPSG